MELQQDNLGEYGVDVSVEPIEQVRQPPSTISIVGKADRFVTAAPSRVSSCIDNEQLPEIAGYYWGLPEVDDGLVTVELERMKDLSRHGPDRRDDPENIPGDARIIAKGTGDSFSLDRFLRDHALSEVDLPEYYTRFEDLETIYRWSVDGVTHITGRFLQKCVRLANGSGKIDTGQTRAIVTDQDELIVTGPRGAFICPIWSLPDEAPPEPPAEATHTVGEFDVAEERPKHREGLERYLQMLEESPYPSIIAYRGLGNGVHRFETASGEVVEVSHNEVNIAWGQTDTLAETVGAYSTEQGDTLCTAVVDDLPGGVGEEVTIAKDGGRYGESEELTGILTGYRTEWDVHEPIRGLSGRGLEVYFRVRFGLLHPDGTLTLEQRELASFKLS